MKYILIEDPEYADTDPFVNPTNKQGILIDSVNSLWLVPKKEVSEEDPRIVSDELKIKKINKTGTIYDKKRMLPNIGSGHTEIEMTKSGLVYLFNETSIIENISEAEILKRSL